MSQSIPTAFVAGDNIMSFLPGVANNVRDDVMDMLMYADFFASQSYRRHAYWSSWMLYYKAQLTAAGCQLKNPIVQAPVIIQSADELDHIGFGIAGSASAPRLVEIVKRSLRVTSLYRYARTFFDNEGAPSPFSAFQVVPCEALKTGEVLFYVCALHVNAMTAGSERELVVRIGGGLYSFSRDAYTLHRERIRSRLREMGEFNIRQIEI